MITHEETRKRFNAISNDIKLCRLYGISKINAYGLKVDVLLNSMPNDLSLFNDYITQQEKKDELLGLYQQLAYTFNMAFRNVLKEKIKALETELKGE